MSSNNQVSVELAIKIEEWTRWNRDEKANKEISTLLENGEIGKLERMLLERISFGTAGLRGRMAAGFACMNELVIVQTAQGLLRHLEEQFGNTLKTNGIVIGYDARHNSTRFANLTAAIFLNNNYPVKMFSKIVPTPFVPFAVWKYQCAAGVMVTASHNPKEDNGYKVYAYNGTQIIPPADKNIQNHILANLEPWPTSWDTDNIATDTKLVCPLEETMDAYMQIISDNVLDDHKAVNAQTKLKFAYTAMHGVGFEYIKAAMKAANLTIVPVEEQVYPDPDFPTVKYPNPEEGKSSLDLSIKTAEKTGCKVILANDPDADRLAVAEQQPSGKWKVFTGNEIGALLGWWQFNCYQKRYPNEPLSNVYVLASTVSSKLLRSMAVAEGFNFLELLTGFKWMGNKAFDLIKEHKRVIFAYEEAIGFMCGESVLDKDGVSAAVQAATLATHLYHHGLTIEQQLQEIYKEYGHHVSSNSYYFCYDGTRTNKIFDRLRNYNGPNNYPTSIMDGKYTINTVRDLTTGYDSSQRDKKAILPVSKSSQMITFEFANGLVATLRTSGTEPKIKYYAELCAPPTETDKSQIESKLNEMVEALTEEFLQPKKNALTPKED